VWDVYMFEGDAYIFKIGLAILMNLDTKFQGEDIDGIVTIINDMSEYFLTPEKLFKTADKINITLGKINSLKASLKPRYSQ